jgi:phosphatidylinositol 3-kinase
MKRQGQLIEALGKRAKELRTSKDPRPKKIEKLRAFLADSKNNMSSIAPLPLPLNAKVTVTGIIAEKCSVFKSNMFPLLLYFRCADETEYPVIFKDGDDMRQDQLVIQLFTLMERLLKKEGLDLKLTAYDVLATAPQQGLAQFIPSKTIAAIMSEHGSLLNYLRANYPDEGSVGTYGVEPGVIDTYIKSCGVSHLSSHLLSPLNCHPAGYCVVTYLLGVGDRHLDNLLLSPDGHFFHGTR